MNAEIIATIAEAFREHREAFGVAVTINNQTITAVVNESPFSRDLIDGGFADSGEVSVKFLIADLTTAAAIGQSAVYRERSFRIQTLTIQPGSKVAEAILRPSRGK